MQNREISDVFTSTTSTDHETILIKDDEQMQIISPDLFGIISKLQSNIVDIKKKQAMDSVILESVRTDVNTTLVLFMTIHGTLNSVLSRAGSLTETITQSTQLRTDCERVETSLTTIQNRFVTLQSQLRHPRSWPLVRLYATALTLLLRRHLPP